MHETSAEIERRSAAGAPPTPGKLRLVGLNDLDGRFGSTKRARALADALRGELGGKLLASQFVAVERAATLIAIAEDARARRIAGDLTISLEDLVRVDNAASRALRALGIKAAPDKPKPGEALSRHLARLASLSGAPDVAGPPRQPPQSDKRTDRAKPRGEAFRESPEDNA